MNLVVPGVLAIAVAMAIMSIIAPKATASDIPGYTYGTDKVAKSPVTLQELELLKQVVIFTEDDEKFLRLAGEVLEDQVEDILDLWYSFVGGHTQLLHYFTGPGGQPDGDYLGAVRKRFGQWILDTCNNKYDQDWLNYQYEIGLRHHRSKKNKTDNVDSVQNIDLRYVIALIYPISATIKGFLANKGHGEDEIEKMHQAWTKSVILQIALWSQPYVNAGDF